MGKRKHQLDPALDALVPEWLVSPRWRWGLVGVCFLVLSLAAVADEPPIQNRPTNFSGAVGTFRISMEAQPTQVLRDETLTLTVRITADGPFTGAPKKPDLRAIAAFNQRFYIEPLPEQPSNGPEWQFVYRLRPRDLSVDAVPSLPLVYFKPSKSPAGRGSYQTAHASSIPITVKEPPPPVAPPTEEAPHFAAPESAYDLAEGSAVLAKPWTVPVSGPVLLALALLLPPGICAAWYLLWRKLYPDAAKVAQQRRSRAARAALHKLERCRRLPMPQQADQAAGAVIGYLRQRVDLTTAEPTPDEAVAPLQALGCEPEIVDKVRLFLQERDRACFADLGDEPRPWAEEAGFLIQELEAALDDLSTRPREPSDPFAPVVGCLLAAVGLAMLGNAGCAGPADEEHDIRTQAESQFQKGLELQAQPDEARKQFQVAAAAFEKLRQHGCNNPSLLRNLGNAYLLAGDLPRAVLTYRQGVEQFPTDGALRDQLDEARALVVYSPGDRLGQPVDDFRPPWLVLLLSGVVVVSFALYCLAWVAATHWFMVRRRGWLWARWCVSSSVGGCSGCGCSWTRRAGLMGSIRSW